MHENVLIPIYLTFCIDLMASFQETGKQKENAHRVNILNENIQDQNGHQCRNRKNGFHSRPGPYRIFHT